MCRARDVQYGYRSHAGVDVEHRMTWHQESDPVVLVAQQCPTLIQTRTWLIWEVIRTHRRFVTCVDSSRHTQV